MRAVHLALLVRCGQPGAPSVLTAPGGFFATFWNGKEFDLPKPYGNWVIENIFFKLIPAEGHGIAAIEAALEQSKRLRASGLRPARDIKLVKVRTQAAAVRIISKAGPLHNAADRDHCIQYMLAVVLLKDAAIEIGDYQNNSPWATDPRVADLRAKMEVIEDVQFTKDYLDVHKKSAASAVTIVLQDGTVLDEVKVEYPIGHVENMQTLPQVRDKFRRNVGTMFERSRVEQMIQAIEDDGVEISTFVDLFAPDALREHKL